MPAAATHVEFGRDILNALPASMRRRITDLPMFWIGTQGPDILFFSHMSVMPGSLHRYGNLMHEEKTKEQLLYMEDYVRDDPALTSYYYGYLCHYALDCKAHSLICSIARYKHLNEGLHEGAVHVRMESQIDVWMLHQRRLSICHTRNIWSMMRISSWDRKQLAAMYHSLLRDVYHVNISESRIRHALVELNLWTPIIRPHYVGSNIFLGGEFFMGSPIESKRLILHGNEPRRVINLHHTSYPMFFDESRIISDSFPELYDDAERLAYRILKYRNPRDIRTNFMGKPL